MPDFTYNQPLFSNNIRRISESPNLLHEYRSVTSPSPGSSKRSSATLLFSELEDPVNKRREVISRVFLYVSFFLGLGIAGGLIYDGYRIVPRHNYSPVLLIDRFDSIDPDIWEHESQVGGFGNGVFVWASNDSANSYVKDGMLYIVPTLTSTILTPAQIEDGYTVNLTESGCTSQANSWQQRNSDCAIRSNRTSGSIIPPVRSARLTTRKSYAIRYGKIEVEAKMPRGDWLWPAIWMMPRDSKYGDWPRSGEIDIAESQGNDIYYLGRGLGRNAVHSTLHWGPAHDLDGYWRTTNTFKNYLKDLSQGFHTYGIEWTPDRITTYIDNKQLTIMGVSFKSSFWHRGKFPALFSNKSVIEDPWSQTGRNSAPFDEYFYLILNLDVGGTNGWFPDDKGDKPWANNSPSAARQFWNSRSKWLETWPDSDYDRGLIIKSVKMWQYDD